MTDYWSLKQAWKRASCWAIRRALGSSFHIQKAQRLKLVGYEFRSFSACFYSSCPKIDGDQPIIEFFCPLPFRRHRSHTNYAGGLILATLYQKFTRNSLVQVPSCCSGGDFRVWIRLWTNIGGLLYCSASLVLRRPNHFNACEKGWGAWGRVAATARSSRIQLTTSASDMVLPIITGVTLAGSDVKTTRLVIRYLSLT